MKGDQFSGVIVDHRTGAIKKAEMITDADDIENPRNGAKPWPKPRCLLTKP